MKTIKTLVRAIAVAVLFPIVCVTGVLAYMLGLLQYGLSKAMQAVGRW